MEASTATKAAAEQAAAAAKAAEQAAGNAPKSAPRPPQDMSAGGIGDFLGSRQGKQLQREIVRGVFGMLKKKL